MSTTENPETPTVKGAKAVYAASCEYQPDGHPSIFVPEMGWMLVTILTPTEMAVEGHGWQVWFDWGDPYVATLKVQDTAAFARWARRVFANTRSA